MFAAAIGCFCSHRVESSGSLAASGAMSQCDVSMRCRDDDSDDDSMRKLTSLTGA